ncbi:HEAT repeat [Paenibacillus sp. 1_12]|uniref:HEAT repeat domain-containing protein n=1 Tax=Paenibacillus sp. 1_12 TaxID=1566278 RepID=UPI0008E512D7|nr:HEAT repeat domain-containing protein [Paenibacillus sp. 1_12]SFL44322.1 HEAT repeat [Paenibacillus sp. 1_12]
MESLQLLTDAQMRQFVTEGYVFLKADFADEFHLKLSETLDQVYKEEGNPGNNILPRIPDLAKVFDHPVIRGALSSVLGEDYMMHPHRHGHFNRSAEAGGWHKDSYWGHYKMRNHHPWWAMIFYYPQEVTLDMGPTGIMPGTQCYQTRTFVENETQEERKATGSAGTFALVHYDIWHRANANIAGKDRYMLKFQFMRRLAPTKASWDHNEEAEAWVNPSSYTAPIYEHEVVWRNTWNWLLGKENDAANNEASQEQLAGWISELEHEDKAIRVRAADQLGLSANGSNEVITGLTQALYDDFEPVALNAAYGLARHGEAGIIQLLKALQDESIHVSRAAAYGVSTAGKAAVNGLIDILDSEDIKAVGGAAFALGEIGDAAAVAIPRLMDLMRSENEIIRRNTVEAIGLIGSSSEESVKGLELGIQDADDQVRFMAGMALTKMGSKAQNAIPVIAHALNDENRYVRATAVDALYSMNTDTAKDILLKFLRDSRWCASTTPNSTF